MLLVGRCLSCNASIYDRLHVYWGHFAMTDLIIQALEKWKKGGMNIYHWFNREDLIEMAKLIEIELKDSRHDDVMR